MEYILNALPYILFFGMMMFMMRRGGCCGGHAQHGGDPQKQQDGSVKNSQSKVDALQNSKKGSETKSCCH